MDRTSSDNDMKSRIEELLEKTLRPLRGRKARGIFNIFLAQRDKEFLTTFDIEAVLKENGFEVNKKEINGFLVSLLEAGLIEKLSERGKPITVEYDDKYTYDRWKLSLTGFKIGERLPNLMAEESDYTLPKLRDLTPSMINKLEDLYLTAKILIILNNAGGEMSYVDLRKKLSIDKEKLAVYSWPDPDHSDKPLFEVKIKPPSLRGKIFKLFGQIAEQNLSFTLTEAGRKLVEEIASREIAS